MKNIFWIFCLNYFAYSQSVGRWVSGRWVGGLVVGGTVVGGFSKTLSWHPFSVSMEEKIYDGKSHRDNFHQKFWSLLNVHRFQNIFVSLVFPNKNLNIIPTLRLGWYDVWKTQVNVERKLYASALEFTTLNNILYCCLFQSWYEQC